MKALINVLLMSSALAYNCFTFRFPLNLGDASGNSVVTHLHYDGSKYYAGGYSTASSLKVAGMSQSAFVVSLDGIFNWVWGKSFKNDLTPSSGRVTLINDMQVVGGNLVVLATGTQNKNYYIMKMNTGTGAVISMQYFMASSVS